MKSLLLACENLLPGCSIFVCHTLYVIYVLKSIWIDTIPMTAFSHNFSKSLASNFLMYFVKGAKRWSLACNCCDWYMLLDLHYYKLVLFLFKKQIRPVSLFVHTMALDIPTLSALLYAVNFGYYKRHGISRSWRRTMVYHLERQDIYGRACQPHYWSPHWRGWNF